MKMINDDKQQSANKGIRDASSVFRVDKRHIQAWERDASTPLPQSGSQGRMCSCVRCERIERQAGRESWREWG